MCGIAGAFDIRATLPVAEASSRVQRMTDAVAHRGPDDSGVWTDAEAGIALGHRRLSIIDLSPLGHQPMHSADGRYVISYNGEVYNFLELRAELAALGHTFRSTSDTEVMLAACTAWGPERAVTRFAGMFAIALWDRQTRTLRLIRDRIGVKPLYWTQRDGVLTFGSELKALMAHPGWRGEVDREAVAAFLRYSYVPTPATIFRGVHKLPPGSILTCSHTGTISIDRYWRLEDTQSATSDVPNNEADAADALDALLRQSIKGRMIADVPLGAFLSGGIDSSTVVALMQAQSPAKVRTFTIGFHEQGYDEATHARAVAAHLGTDHTELYLTPQQAIDVVPSLPDWFDEPFADPSQIPTYLVSAMTRKHVTVALSGDGGDELFAGYPRYRHAKRLRRRFGMLPGAVRRGAGALLRRVPEPVYDRAGRMLPASLRPQNAGRKAHRLGELMAVSDPDRLIAEFAATWPHDCALVPGTTGAYRHAPQHAPAGQPQDFVSRMQHYDLETYLPDDIMTKVDRCSMAVALEAREPMLDHRLVEFVWRLPPAWKLHAGQSKRLLRKVLHRYVPAELVERPKMGFSIPVAAWLRGPLRGWAEDLLSPAKLTGGVLDASEVRRLWDDHRSGRANRDTVLWSLLMFQAWKQRYRVSA